MTQQTPINTQPLRELFTAILQDLERTERRSWRDDLDAAEAQVLATALENKISSYKKLVDLQLAAAEGQDLTALLMQIILPAADPPAIVEEVDETTYEPCEYCDGQGGSDVAVGGIEGWVPCLPCDGSGQVAVEKGGA